MNRTEVLELIYAALRSTGDSRINDVTFEGDHNSGEIILTTDDGTTKQCWVLNSSSVVETNHDCA